MQSCQGMIPLFGAESISGYLHFYINKNLGKVETRLNHTFLAKRPLWMQGTETMHQNHKTYLPRKALLNPSKMCFATKRTISMQENNGNLVQSPSSIMGCSAGNNTAVSLESRTVAAASPDGSSGMRSPPNIAPPAYEAAVAVAPEDDAADNCKCSPPPSIGGCCCDAFSAKTLGKLTDVNLMHDGIFLMFALSNFLTSIGFNVPYVYTVVSKQAQEVLRSASVQRKSPNTWDGGT